MELKSSNYKALKFVPSGAHVKGVFLTKTTIGGELSGFAGFEAGVNGKPLSVIWQADVVQVPKAAVVFAAGDALYVILATGVVTNVDDAGNNDRCGYAIEAALSGDATAEIYWDTSLQATA